MKVASDITNREELNQMKSVMEIFIVNKRIKQIIE